MCTGRAMSVASFATRARTVSSFSGLLLMVLAGGARAILVVLQEDVSVSRSLLWARAVRVMTHQDNSISIV